MGQTQFRFGYQLPVEDDATPVAAAVRAEQLGFDVVSVADHVGAGRVPSPMPMLGAIANATDGIRIGTLVLNNDMRNPVQLAWEAVTLDRLSDGRVELGLGAGHTPQEYRATGLSIDSAAIRKQRLCESVELIRQLLDGDTIDYDGTYYQLAAAHVGRSIQERLPILVGGNGEVLLKHAARHADIIGLQGLGKTKVDGHGHAARWTADHLDKQIEQIHAGAVSRQTNPELNALVQHVEITDDRDAALEGVCGRVEGLTYEDASTTPYLMVGTVAEIGEHIHECYRRWGISYFTVRDDNFAPVIQAIRWGG
jgi:probable F420-dependent oxidoreductase